MRMSFSFHFTRMIDLVVTFVFQFAQISICSRRKGFDACAIDSAANKALIPMTLMAIHRPVGTRG